jgi:transposase
MKHMPIEELWACVVDFSRELTANTAALATAQTRLASLEAELAVKSAALIAAEGRVTSLETEITALKAKASLPTKTSGNSSLPPSSQKKANGEKQAVGRRRSYHAGVGRQRQLPDVVLACVPAVCEKCQADLTGSLRIEIGRQQVLEVPTFKAVVVELVRYQRVCACGHCQEDAYPAGYTAAHQAFGPGLHALISYLNGTHHIAQDRLAQLLHDLLGIDISAGAIVNSLHYTAQHLETAVETILETIRQSPIVGSDETSLRLDNRNGWLWVLQTPTESYFTAVDSRAGRILKTILGEARIPIWVSDLYAGQLMANAERFAICNAHTLRDLQYAIDAGDTQFSLAMRDLLREGLLLTRQRDTLDPTAYQAQVERIRTKAYNLLDLPLDHKHARRLQKRFRKHFEKIFLFLDESGVPFENNAAERALRPAVIHRKVIGGFRSVKGAIAYAFYRTIEDTSRKRQVNIFDALFAALGSPLTLPMRLAR